MRPDFISLAALLGFFGGDRASCLLFEGAGLGSETKSGMEGQNGNTGPLLVVVVVVGSTST